METVNLMPAEKPAMEVEPKAPALELVKEEKNAPGKKPRAPKARPVEELVEASYKSLTEKEKELLIEFYKEQLTIADNKIEQFKQNADAAFKRARNVEENFNSMEAYYKERLAYLTNSTKIFYQSVCLATKGDVK